MKELTTGTRVAALGLLTMLLATVLLLATGCTSPQRPNIVIVLVDALRRDHLGFYGYSEPVSPFLDSLAEQSIIFENAYAHGSLTFVSTSSLFTSKYFPPILFIDVPPDARQRLGHHQSVERSGWLHVLAPKGPTFLETLAEGGYHTTAFLTNPHHHEDSGIPELFLEPHILLGESSGDGRVPYVDARAVKDAFIDWVSAYDDKARPFTAYVHLMDPHSPNSPPPDFASRFVRANGVERVVSGIPSSDQMPSEDDLAFMIQSYDAEIAYVDDTLRYLFKETAELTSRNTIFILTSDHGEEFMDHGGLGHGRTLEKEMIWVPLLIYGAEESPRRYHEIARHVDVGPTVLALAGIDPPPSYDGRALISREIDSAPTRERLSVAYEHRAFFSITTAEWHYIRNTETGAVTLYDNRSDPAGLRNVAESHSAVVERLGEYFAEINKARNRSLTYSAGLEKQYLSNELFEKPRDELLDQLRSLGYLQ